MHGVSRGSTNLSSRYSDQLHSLIAINECPKAEHTHIDLSLIKGIRCISVSTKGKRYLYKRKKRRGTEKGLYQRIALEADWTMGTVHRSDIGVIACGATAKEKKRAWPK